MDDRIRVLRCVHERYVDNLVLARDNLSGCCVMAGAITTNCGSKLFTFPGNITAHRYVDEILQSVLVPLIQ